MKIIYRIECLLLWISLFAISATAGIIMAEPTGGYIYGALILGVVAWGFSVWRKMKEFKGNEMYERPVVWMECAIYLIIAGPIIANLYKQFLDPYGIYPALIILLYCLIPIIGGVGLAWHFRKELKQGSNQAR